MDVNRAVEDYYRYREIINTDTTVGSPWSSIRLPSKDEIDREKLDKKFSKKKEKKLN